MNNLTPRPPLRDGEGEDGMCTMDNTNKSVLTTPPLRFGEGAGG